MTPFLVLVLLVSAQPTPDALFAHGNARYDEGDYDGARRYYTQVLSSGYASPALYLNLADAYFRLDSLGQSVRYLERARLLAPTDARVAHNLRITRARLGLADASVPLPYWQTAGIWLHRNVPPALPYVVGFVLFLAALALVTWRVWTGTASPWVRRGLFVLLPPAVLLIGLSYAISSGSWMVQRAAVLQDVEVQSQRGQGSISLPEGRVVRVLTQGLDRVEIELPDGSRGWVPAHVVGVI